VWRTAPTGGNGRADGWAAVSVHVLSWVLKHSEAKLGARLVLLVIADRCANDDGTGAWPLLSTIARDARLSETAVHDAIRRLVADGQLEVAKRANHSSEYRVIMTASGAESVPQNGEGSGTWGSESVPENGRGSESAPTAGVRNPYPGGSESEPGGSEIRTPGGSESEPRTISRTVNRTVTEPSTARAPARVQARDPEAVERICTELADRIEGNTGRRPTVTANWRDAIRLMMDRDHVPENLIMGAIKWSQDSEFWRCNILSAQKLREKYLTMKLQAERDRGRQNGHSTTDDRVAQGLRVRDELLAEEAARAAHTSRKELTP
jgi:hypothetical protein